MNVTEFTAQKREKVGTGSARDIRNKEELPAIVYGLNKDNAAISVDRKTLELELKTPSYLTKLYTVKIGSDKEQVIIRDVQYHPVTDRPMHVDFYRIDKNSKVDMAIPVRFINEAKSLGMKQGGVLNIIMHEIPLSCPAVNIPDSITVDLEGLNLGDTIHLGDIKFPDGAVALHSDSNITIATIVTPSATKSAQGAGEDSSEENENAEDEKASEKE